MPKKVSLPEPVERSSPPFVLDNDGWWLVLSDVHIPFHDKTTVELAVKQARKHKAKGVLLNGDLVDCHELSRFDKTPDDPRYRDEVAMGRQFLAWLRQELPKARIVWKDGNHEERLLHYLTSRAPALFGLDVLTLPNLLEFAKYGIEHVTDRRVIHAGHLHVIHGHEYRPGIQAPVNPARGLFLRAKSVALCGHFHQVSEHTASDIAGKPQAAWSTGCACNLSPLYAPLNNWSHGFAMVDIGRTGGFNVRNFRVLGGAVV